MSYINNEKNHARYLLGLALATIVLTILVVRPAHSVTQQHAVGALGPQGQSKRRRVQSITQRQLAKAGQRNRAATDYSTQLKTPATKADGKIAFNRYTGEVTAIFTMNTDGSDVTQITDDQYFNFDPAWSPDGTRIAFDTLRDNGDSEIYLMNADGSNQAGFTPPALGIDAAWSPDGKKIAYWQDYVGIIYVMDADGSNRKQLTNGDAFDLEPSWSPDGSKIVFSSYRDGQSEIYVMNADGSNQTRFTNDVVNYDEEPVWSPDGSRIAFTKYLGCIDFGIGIFCSGAQIMIMQADGSNPTYLTGGEDFDWSSFSTWSPDGTQLAFEGYVVGEVYSISADGSGLVDLTNNDADDFFPAWGPQPSTSPSCPNPIDCAEVFVRQHIATFSTASLMPVASRFGPTRLPCAARTSSALRPGASMSRLRSISRLSFSKAAIWFIASTKPPTEIFQGSRCRLGSASSCPTIKRSDKAWSLTKVGGKRSSRIISRRSELVSCNARVSPQLIPLRYHLKCSWTRSSRTPASRQQAMIAQQPSANLPQPQPRLILRRVRAHYDESQRTRL